MLSITVSDPSTYDGINPAMLGKDFAGADHLLQKHIIPGLGLYMPAYFQGERNISFVMMRWILNECIKNANEACVEKALRNTSWEYHAHIVLQSEEVSDKVSFHLRDNWIWVRALWNTYKRTNIREGSMGLWEKVMKGLPIDYRRDSDKKGSTVTWLFDFENPIPENHPAFSLLP